ncbi:DUF637 domain-containing protein [Burkholderia gladioli]|uniref:DUF637 domain-containing protein n=2 Tax=Burkholderia gladioli TaxID=28095 RepID=UPI00163ECF30|nr:DUF637 domain-containing protein [Burkholderia gladioli]
MSSAAGQLVGTGKLNLGSAFEAGAIAAITAGLMNGITYSAESGLGFTTQPVTAGAGTQTLANLAGVKPVVGTVTNQATTAVTVDLGTRGLAMLAGGVIDAGVGTAIRGGSFLDALKGSLVSEVSAAGAIAIGDASVSGSLVEAGTPGYWLAHAALGCASSAAMGTGCAGGAIGGAVSAAFSPDIVKAIDPTGAPLDPGQQAALAAFATLAGGGFAALVGQNATAGATAAQNEALNNTGEHAADAAKNGGLLGALGTWLQNTYGDPVGSIQTWINEFGGKVQAGAKAKASESPVALISQGIDTGVSAVVGLGSGAPPAAGLDAVLVSSGMIAPPPVSGNTPSNALLSSGGNEGSSGAANGKNAADNVRAGGTVELFTDSSGPKVSGAVGVGPTDPTAVASNAMNMPNISSNSQAKVVANNPFIPSSAGGTGSMMDYLPEAARITQSGGEIVINGNGANPYFSNMPSAVQLDQLGLRVQYQGGLLPEYQGLHFARTDGSTIPTSTMRSIVLVKK